MLACKCKKAAERLYLLPIMLKNGAGWPGARAGEFFRAVYCQARPSAPILDGMTSLKTPSTSNRLSIDGGGFINRRTGAAQSGTALVLAGCARPRFSGHCGLAAQYFCARLSLLDTLQTAVQT